MQLHNPANFEFVALPLPGAKNPAKINEIDACVIEQARRKLNNINQINQIPSELIQDAIISGVSEEIIIDDFKTFVNNHLNIIEKALLADQNDFCGSISQDNTRFLFAVDPSKNKRKTPLIVNSIRCVQLTNIWPNPNEIPVIIQ
jgi:hypothetical protein